MCARLRVLWVPRISTTLHFVAPAKSIMLATCSGAYAASVLHSLGSSSPEYTLCCDECGSWGLFVHVAAGMQRLWQHTLL